MHVCKGDITLLNTQRWTKAFIETCKLINEPSSYDRIVPLVHRSAPTVPLTVFPVSDQRDMQLSSQLFITKTILCKTLLFKQYRLRSL